MALLLVISLASTGCGEKKIDASQAAPAASDCRAHQPQARRTGSTCRTGSPTKTSEAGTMDADRNRQLVRCRAWRPKNGQRGVDTTAWR